ncbi:hypothetical protein HPB49_012082 [Dermacentor silvarum]|uniref:Uncharacterized protein n=1 Tax=Dermacentor silvarum TaxID=543639 RepID=A0ACB8D5P0_DERSI|nr:hypothetical protein HPB49_012082 [Dermacentor silvarum]
MSKVDVVEFRIRENKRAAECQTTWRRPRVTVPILLCMTIIGGYICGGAVLFSVWEEWNYLDGSYFCFVTLSTIGFGDLVPGDTVVSDSGSQEKLVICSLYLLVDWR